MAAPIIKPKAFFSFYTPTVWKPEPLWTPGDTLNLSVDFGGGDVGMWVARMGRWTGAARLGEQLSLPDGSAASVSVANGCIMSYRNY